jgi:hypothetical protein
LIIKSEAGDNDVELGRRLVEEAIYAYHQNVSLADETNPLIRLAETTGKAGAVYITTENRLESIIEHVTEEQSEDFIAAVGPGILNPYRGLAMTYRRESGHTIFDFVLDYETPAEAAAGVPVLRERLKQGQSYLKKGTPLSEIWDTESVSNQGTLLEATVRLRGTAPRHDLTFITMISTMDYWFLYSGP